jgi:hypothetical protein
MFNIDFKIYLILQYGDKAFTKARFNLFIREGVGTPRGTNEPSQHELFEPEVQGIYKGV